jgi:hypothetical protein
MKTKMTPMKLSLKLLAALVSASFCLQASAAIITVTNTTDNDPGSLRQAIAAAASGDTINFDPSLNGQTITLTSGQLSIGTNLTITGPGANQLAINGNATSSVFYIGSGTVTISGLTITNGSNGSQGGGIDSAGTLTITNSTLSGNSGYGGAILNRYGTTMTITNSTLSGNSGGNGGGIYNGGALTITNCTLSGNTTNGGYGGGGVYSDNGSTLTITNSTLSGNTANGNGGAIFIIGYYERTTMTITNSTLSGNTANGGYGSDIFNYYGTATSGGYNLSSDNGGGVLTATGDQINTDPLLGPLQDNGGPTFTHALLVGSPAIDAGDPNFDPNSFTPPLTTDQRGSGFPRVVNSRIDIGAFEVQASFKCPHLLGYWKSNPTLWPASSLPMTLGNQTYSKTELLTILKTSVGAGTKADASLILADQLIAAKLNIANGSDPSPVSSTITHADSLLFPFTGKLPYKVKTSSAIGQMMVNDGTTLGNYNNGLLTLVCSP